MPTCSDCHAPDNGEGMWNALGQWRDGNYGALTRRALVNANGFCQFCQAKRDGMAKALADFEAAERERAQFGNASKVARRRTQ